MGLGIPPSLYREAMKKRSQGAKRADGRLTQKLYWSGISENGEGVRLGPIGKLA